jgi:1-acyl-sn-glycerol-3-phosphate acyltransferase
MIRAIYSFLYFKVMGWKINGAFPPDLKKYIVAVAPHTSSWDFIIGVMVRSIMKMQNTKFLGKSPLFKPPFGWFFRAIGGYPVDRSKHNDMVQQVTDIFNSHENFILGLAPEGTRKKVDKLKSGFYYIAKKAGIPIVPCGFDFAKKEVVIGEPFYPSEDIEKDMSFLISFYRNVTGKNPQLGIQ